MLKKLYRTNQEDISMPNQIKNLLYTMPNIGIELLDFDYIGNATEADYTFFASKLYNLFGLDSYFILIMNSNKMKNSRLLTKMFKFDLTNYDFTNKIETWSVPINNSSIIFLGAIPIKTYKDFKLAINFLFSGIYDAQNIMMYSRSPFDMSHIKTLLNESLHIKRNRYEEIQNVNLSMSILNQNKEDLKILYPYGGTDFGSFMMFMF